MATSKNNAKAIIWGRVSTIAQEIEAQVNDMIQQAIGDGYKRENLIVIKSKGASARKLNQLYIQEVEELLETLKSDPTINCVYVWEVSRLARVELPFYQMKDYVVKNKIQLIVRTPEIHLLREDGTVDLSQEVILNLMVTLAKQEMEIKEKRFERAKRTNAEQMKFSGGANVKFGYTLDANKTYIIDPEQAEIVRLIYSLYLQSDMGYSRLNEELKQRGINLRTGMVANILSDKSYLGECKTPRGLVRKYPVIIDRETWEKVEAKRGNNDREANKSSKYFFASRLIVCPDCGKHYIVTGTTGVYKCMGAWSKECDNNTQIKVNTLDSLLWYDVHNDLLMTLTFNKAEKVAEYQKKINVFETKIKACESVIDGVETKLNKVGELYEVGVYNREKMMAKTNEIRSEAQQAENEIAGYKAQVENLQTLIQTLNDGGNILDRLNASDEEINNVENLKEMYNIIHSFISKVEITECPLKSSKYVKKIVITHVSGEVKTYYYYYRKQTGTKIFAGPSVNDPEARQSLIDREMFVPMDYDDDFKEIIRIPSKYVPTGNKRGPKKGTKYNRRKKTN